MDMESRLALWRNRAAVVLLLTAAALICDLSPANAFDLPPPGTAGNERVIFDSSADTGLGGSSVDFNTTFAPFGAGTNGLRARLTGSFSWYEFVSDPAARTRASGRSQEGDILVGYGAVAPRVSVIALAGPALVHAVDGNVSRDRTGLKGVVSMFARPTADTMLYVSLNYVTIRDFFQLQGKFGARIPLGVYVGPEIKFAGAGEVTHVRVGAHLSGIAVGPAAISISAGQLHDNQLGNGQYVSLNLYAGF
jgi:hypothetical protein